MPMEMARGVLIVTVLLLCAICNSWSASFSVFVGKDEAHQVLKICKRANHFLEEIHPGNLERECMEEACSFEEAKEIFQSHEKTMEFWFDYKDLNPCKENPCKNGGVCKLKHYNYFCICPPTFGGKHCEIETFECWYKNGGCWQYCQDTAGSLRVACSCAEGYALAADDGKRCVQSAQFPCGLVKMLSMRALDEDNPGLNGMAEKGILGLNGMAEGGTPGPNGMAEGGIPGVSGMAEEGTPGPNGMAEGGTPGPNGMAEGGTLGLSEMAEEGTPGPNGMAEGGTLGLSGMAEGGTPGLSGMAEEGTPGPNGMAEGGTLGLSGMAEGGTPGPNGMAEGGTPGLSGMAEEGTPGPNGMAEGGTPRPNSTVERGAPALSESAKEGDPRPTSMAERGAPGIKVLAKESAPQLNGMAEGGALGLNGSAEKGDPRPGSTAERGAPGLTELSEESAPRLSEMAERGALGLNEATQEGDPRPESTAEKGATGLNKPVEEGARRLHGSAAGRSIHDGLTHPDAEGNVTDRDLHSWIKSHQAAEHDDARITSGSLCRRGHCPWQVLIRNRRGHGFCGGSLISSRWVVTAAHCLDIVRPHHVTLGDFDKHQREVKEQKIEVQQSWTHPHYDADNYNGDIALLYLSSEVIFNEYVLPICLPNPNLATLLTAAGTKGMVSGWGSTYHKGPATRFLLKVMVPVVSMETCRKSTEKLITDNMFCAGYAAQAQDACKGDSGGPFAVPYRNTWYLLGIVSWGEGCAEEGKYGVYTRVANYVPWIKEVVENKTPPGRAVSSL